jgi:hypothetical protein
MISAWWLILAFLLGSYAGILVMALLAAARDLPKEVMREPALRAALRRVDAA